MAVISDARKLTIYFGERDRADGRFLADVLAEIYARHELQTSLVIRGMDGFGHKHHLRTDRLLTLSEDLPLVSVAVDSRERIETALAEVNELPFEGLLTLERAQMLVGPIEPTALPSELGEEIKLTVYLGRHARADGRPAYEAVVGLLHERGISGATVLLGVDGTVHGLRRRARFFGANTDVPLMVIAVGDAHAITDLLPELGALLPRPLITLERIRVCKRDGRKLAEPERLAATDPSGESVWQKLMVYAGEQARSGAGHPLHHELVRTLRRAGAAGATSLRGIWGYHGDHRPHGDTFAQLRRRVPILTVIIDTPEHIRQWFKLVDELTEQTGLVTSEMVPSFRTGPALSPGRS